MRAFTVDAASSRITVRTRAEGLLARLAHDLELSTRAVEGQATLDGEAWTAELRAPVASLHVDGVLHGDTLDTSVLSASDRSDIERKMAVDVFGGLTTLTGKAHGLSRSAGEVDLSIDHRSVRAPLTLSVRELDGGALLASGRFMLSLKALGAKPIKGPLGAFSVKDAVDVLFEIPLRPA